MLIICKSIEKKELVPLAKSFPLSTLKKASLKALNGLGDTLGSIFRNSQLIKVYLTGKGGAGRIIFLLFLDSRNVVPIMLRLKTDKLGKNMSMSNNSFVEKIESNMQYALTDIENGDYQEISINS